MDSSSSSSSSPVKRTWWSQWLQQLVALTLKCLTILSAKPLLAIAIIFMPSVFIAGLDALYKALNSVDVSVQSVAVQKCVAFDVYQQPLPAQPCATLLYAPSNHSSVQAVMQRFCAGSGLQCGKDVLGFESEGELSRWLYTNVATMQSDLAVVFDPKDLRVEEGKVTYQLWVNTTRDALYAQSGLDNLWVSSGYSSRLLGVQKELDAAIIAEAAGAPMPSSSGQGASAIGVSAAPFSDYESVGFGGGGDSSTGPGLLLLMLSAPTFPAAGVTIASLLILSLVTGEKAKKLVSALRSIGLLESAFWLSWSLSTLPLFFALALVTAAVLQATRILMFSNTDYSVLLVSVFLLATSTASMALCCASFVSSQRAVNVTSFCKFAVVIVLSICLTFPGTMDGHSLYAALYEPGTSKWELIILGPWPIVHFGRMTTSIFNRIYFGNYGVVPDPTGANGGGGGNDGFHSYSAYDVDFEALPLRNGGVGFPWTVHKPKKASETASYPSSSSSSSFPSSSSQHDRLWGGEAPLSSIQGVQARIRAASNTLRTAVSQRHASAATAQHALFDEPDISSGSSPSGLSALRGAAGWAQAGGRMLQGGGGGGGGGGSGSSLPAGGYTFTWSDLTRVPDPVTVTVNGLPTQYTDFTPSFNLWMMSFLTAGYLLAAWYFGQIATGDLGAAQPFYFIVSPYYWGLASLPATVESGDTVAAVQKASGVEHSVRVHKLTKNYKGSSNTALKEVSLVLPPNQLTALLGQNGSGKTTLISVLTGRVSATHGEAFVFGRSVRSEMSVLQDRIGLCPQDDLLYDELSARQHLTLYARFKGVPEADLTSHVADRLALVNLSDVADQPVTTFSGGMKRRLSVALSTCGSPQLIFLDEPSTGLDPLSRRKIHSMIEKLKCDGRVIVLTTHSMQEADTLGDSVAILDGGKLRAFGTPLFLKGRFGAGYQINLLTEPARVPELKELVAAHLPGAEIVGDVSAQSSAADASTTTVPGAVVAAVQQQQPSSPDYAAQPGGPSSASSPSEGDVMSKRQATGVLTIGVPRAMTSSIPAFLRVLQQHTASEEDKANDHHDHLVKEWGVSNSTLEEVFLRLVASKAVNSVVDGGAGPIGAVSSTSASDPRGTPAHAHQTSKTCVLCGCAPTDLVTLFTSAQVSVTSPDLICAACSSRSIEEIQQVRDKAAAAASLPVAGSKAAASESVPQKKRSPSSYSLEGNAVEGGEGTLSKALLGGGGSSSGDGGGEAGSALVSSSSIRGKAKHDDDFLPPVSFVRQASAVLLLRLRLQSKQRWPNICNVLFVAAAATLTAVLQPGATMVSGVYCPKGGYYTPGQDTIGYFCHEGNFTDFLLKPSVQPSAAAAASATAGTNAASQSSARRVSSVQTGPAASASKASTATPQAPLSAEPLVRQPLLTMYQPTCFHFDPVQGYCTDTSPLPVATDWRQAILYQPSGNVLPYQDTPGTGVFYTDVSASSASADPAVLPFASWDLIGLGPGILNSTTAQYAYFTDVGYLYNVSGANGAAGIDAQFVDNQRVIAANSQNVMPYPCQYYGVWNYQMGVYTGWFTNVTDGIAWALLNMPSYGLAVQEAVLPGNGSGAGSRLPSFKYDLRMWAAQQNSGFEPGRNNIYQWTRVFFANPSQPNSCYWAFPVFSTDNQWPTIQPGMTSYSPPQPVSTAMNGLHTAFLRNAMLRAGRIEPSNVTPQDPHIHASFLMYPEVNWYAAAAGSTSTIQPLLFPLFTLFLLPAMAYPVGHEKQNRLWAMITMAGGRRAPYIAAHYAFCVLLFLAVALVYLLAGYLSGAASFTNTGPALLIALVLTWAHSQAGWALLLGTALPSPRAATIISYILVVVVSVANFLCFMFLTPWPSSLTWVPILSYARAATLILAYGGSWVQNGSEAQAALLITLLQGTLALLAGVYLHAVVPGPDGGSVEDVLGPFRPVYTALRRGCMRAIGRGSASAKEEGSRQADGYVTIPGMQSMDSDVKAEIRRVLSGGAELASESAIYLAGLVKEYPVKGGAAHAAVSALPPDAGWFSRFWARFSATAVEVVMDIFQVLSCGRAGHGSAASHAAATKRAVDCLSLAVAKGEVMGLLGPNGAGKTTTIAMLTGLTRPTTGLALVEGYDVTTDLSSVWRVLGVCPQFDTVWDDLTVREHLSFYASLKGVPSHRTRAEVQQVAEKVALDGDQFDTFAKRLSGGERRRLSLGIALLGGPKVLFCDEPSTGLDAAARREMWRVIQAEKAAGRTLLITTHAMEEADALCDRIAIVCKGRLQAVGSQLRLKAKYGDGYTLNVTMALSPTAAPTPDAAAARAEAFVRSFISPGATLLSRVGLSATFLLPRVHVPQAGAGQAAAALDVAGVFALLEARKADAGIVEYGIGQSSLDEVFIRVVESAE